jgi:hypothetical protein
MRKNATLLLITVLVLPSSVMVSSALAQSIPKPSIPEFTVKYLDNSYDVAPTYGVDPYNGENVVIEAGYHVENKSIEVSIKNQPFTNYEDHNGNNIMLYYDVGWKGHFEDYWKSFNSTNYMYLVSSASLMADGVLVYPDSPFTVFSFGFTGNNGSDTYRNRLEEVSVGDQIDFQVEALIGYYTKVYDTPVPGVPGSQNPYHYEFTGEESGWSSTQTLTIEASQTPSPELTPTPTPSNEPQSSDQQVILGVAIAAVVIGVGLGLLLYLMKRK